MAAHPLHSPLVTLKPQSPASAPRPHTHTRGYAGSTVVKTPTIDTLARHAVHLTNFVTPTWCAPSRAALMAGRAPWEIGVTAALMEPPPRDLALQHGQSGVLAVPQPSNAASSDSI